MTAGRRRLNTRQAIWAVAIVIAACVGVAAGVGGFTFHYARGASYMLDDPRACANCHVMTDQYQGWLKSSHRAVATCNDCHTPQAFFAKYFTKALNGYHHSAAFTTGDFHEPIRIGARNRGITEGQCRTCHAALVVAITGPHAGGPDMSCIRCHDSVGHRTGK